MANIVLLLVKSSLQPSSIPTYRRAWKLFYQFLFNTLPGTSTNIPISPPTLALFIAYLFDHHYASSTVNSYVSAIGYSHKLAGLHDPTKSFFINQMLKGYGKIGCRLDSRLPITIPILHRIVWATSHLSDSFFNTCRFQAMCLFAFYTFARVGEITASASGTTIYLHQVSKLVNDNQEAVAFKVTFLKYKHNAITTNPPFPSPFLVKLLAALCNIYWLIYKHEGTHLALFFKCLMAPLSLAQFSQRSFPRLLSSVVLIRPGIRAIVFASVLQLMLLIRGCLMRRLGPWGAGSLMPF